MQAVVAALVATVGVVFLAGARNENLNAVQQQINDVAAKQQADHDKVVSADQKLTDIQSDVSEIKGDVKHLLEHEKR